MWEAAVLNVGHGLATGLIASQLHTRYSWRVAAVFVGWSAVSYMAGRVVGMLGGIW